MTGAAVHRRDAGHSVDASSLDASSVDGGSAAMGDACSYPRLTASGGAGTGGCRRLWRLPSTESSVTSLRRELNELIGDAGLSSDERYDLLLAVCEAASNAIEHATDPSQPFIDVLAEISGGRVTIVVRDYGQWCNVSAGPHRGRGLGMMWHLADTAVAASREGTTVTIRSCPRHDRSPVSLARECGAADGGVAPPSAVGGV